MIKKVDRRNSSSIKWNKDRIRDLCGNPEAEPFWIADMDLSSPVEASQAVMEIAQLGAYGYPMFPTLKDDIVSFVKRRHEVEVDPDDLVISSGVLNSLAVILEHTQGSVVVPVPAYKPFMDVCAFQSRQMIQWRLGYDRESAQFSLNLDEFEAILRTHHPKVLIFCSPHNPGGVVWNREELTKVALLAKAYGVFVISDEIHCDLVFKGYKHTTFYEIANSVDLDSVTLMAPSKTFNIAGEHFSFCLFSNPLTRMWYENRLRQLFCNETSYLAGNLAHACYADSGTWLDDLIDLLEGNANYIQSYLKANIPELKLTNPHASFICFMDCSGILEAVKRDARDNPGLYDPRLYPKASLLSLFFGQRASSAFNGGPWFGEGFEEFVRFNYATDISSIQRALARMKEAVAKLRTK